MEVDGNTGKKRRSNETARYRTKRSKGSEDSDYGEDYKAGKIKKILMRNFMCHDAFEVVLNPNVNFIVGRNGSGKSAVLTALTIGLGARANVANRGSSVKGLVKQGKQTATIEITLVNKGPMAYKPDIYGDSIIVFRTIGTSTSYKIKNWRGEVVSTKRKDLDDILRAMNIQIDNPIAILNQDISRTFLVSCKPDEMYELFMKATLLDVIGSNYKDANIMCQEEYVKLQQYNEILSETRKEIELLQRDIKRAEEIDKFRDEVVQIEMEMLWSIAISEEAKLAKVEDLYKKCEESVTILQATQPTGQQDMDLTNQIRELEEQIKSAEEEMRKASDACTKAKQTCNASKDTYSTKLREWRSVQSKIKRLEDDIQMIHKEIHKLESCDSGETNERNETKRELAEYEQKLDEVEAMLRTQQTSQMHLETDKMRLLKDIQAAKIEVNTCEGRIQKIKREISALKLQSDNSLTVFGRNIPRLLRRIDEEYSNGQFKKKPRGPLGAYIKIKDPAWTAAVENYLGAGTFSMFCVDNSQDANVLNAIIREIYLDERPPQIICSKFYDKVHDIRDNCTRAPGYSNLLDAMDISDPVITNCLIDQREVECVLLIPTSKEASDLLSDVSTVPRNCKRAFTKQGDMFYPDPHYRSYGGPRSLRAKFLQVSTTDAIQALEDELQAAKNDRTVAAEAHTTASEKLKRTSNELMSVNSRVTKLRSAQNQYKTSINDLKDKIESNEAINVIVYKNELTELEKKLQQEKALETPVGEEVLQFQKDIKCLEQEVKRHRDERQNIYMKINPLKENIKLLEEDKQAIHEKSQHTVRKLQAVQQALQNTTAELEKQERVTKKALADAQSKCERISTQRSAGELDRLSKELRGKIREIERQFGTIEELRQELKEKEAKCGKDLQLATKIENSYQIHLNRLKTRRKLFNDMKHTYGLRIQESFSNVLDLRKKKGTITIDHEKRILELKVAAQDDIKKTTSDTRSLSGGERSYSTVAFILALWDCTGLPFYFLDEFDVFMDKVNRRTIMDILLDHTRSHPQSQFIFLTPLDTSHILVDDYITVHQIAAPERASQA